MQTYYRRFTASAVTPVRHEAPRPNRETAEDALSPVAADRFVAADSPDLLGILLTFLVFGEIDQEKLDVILGRSISLMIEVVLDLSMNGLGPEVEHFLREARLVLREFEHVNGILVLPRLRKTFRINVPRRQTAPVRLPRVPGTGKRVLRIALFRIELGEVDVKRSLVRICFPDGKVTDKGGVVSAVCSRHGDDAARVLKVVFEAVRGTLALDLVARSA